MITNPLRHPFNTSRPSWPKPTPGLAARAVFHASLAVLGLPLGRKAPLQKPALPHAVSWEELSELFIPIEWGCGLGLYFQHSLPAPHTVPRLPKIPKPQQGHGASKTWVPYCDGAFPQAGGPHRSRSARGRGTAPE